VTIPIKLYHPSIKKSELFTPILPYLDTSSKETNKPSEIPNPLSMTTTVLEVRRLIISDIPAKKEQIH